MALADACNRMPNLKAALMCMPCLGIGVWPIWSYFRPYLGIQTLRGQANRAAAD